MFIHLGGSFDYDFTPFYKNMFFWQKDPKKDNSFKCKVNTLAH